MTYTPDRQPIHTVTLLTKEEYVRYRENIMPLPHEESASCRWWLKEEVPYRGYGTSLVDENTKFYIDSNGTVKEKTPDMPKNGEIFPDSVYCVCQVRPVLHSENLTIGEKLSFGGYEFTAISEHLALCDESIGISYYSHEKDMDKACDYEYSEVKCFIEDWLKKVKELEENKEEEGDRDI